jgi:hypothetical protein
MLEISLKVIKAVASPAIKLIKLAVEMRNRSRWEKMMAHSETLGQVASNLELSELALCVQTKSNAEFEKSNPKPVLKPIPLFAISGEL